MVEVLADRARDRADAHLQTGFVGNEIRDVLPDSALDRADDRVGVLVRRHVHFDAEVDPVHVDEAVAERPRHRFVDLGDDLATADGRDDRVHRRAK